MEEEIILSPFVYWAQSESSVSLRVDLKNVQNPLVSLQEQSLIFKSIGVGAQGEKNYGFNLEFSDCIDTKKSRFRVLDRHVELHIVKKAPAFWPRLLKDTKKPAWLKIDFDKWMHEEDLEDEARDIMEDYPGLYEQIKAEELGWPAKRESMKKVYLFLYNLWQFVGFIYIISVMMLRYHKEGPESMVGTYEAVGWMLRMCFMSQFLEVLHPLVGYTKGSASEAFIKVGGRSVVFFCLIESETRLQDKPVIFYLFFVWSLIELVRYPYYMLRVYDVEIALLTWLRYTVWIPLNPLAFICEGVVILRSIPYFEETGMYSVALPNSWNFAFHMPSLLRCYLLFFFFPAMYKMMAHMYQLRVKKLGPNMDKRKSD